MPVPYSFGAATSAIPLSQLDANFNTPITLGNTAIQLGNTVTTLNNMTLANVTISSGNVTITNVTVTTANATTVNTTTLIATTANVTTGNVTNLISGNVSLTGGSITGTPISGSTGSFTTLTTSSTVTLNGGTANGVAYLNASNVLTTGSALVFDGSNLGLGVTPSAWGGGKALQVGTTTSLWFDGSGSTYYGNNFYYNSGFKYTSAGRYATAYLTTDTGQHQWLVTQSTQGANNPITFTQAMTLDASGRLGIGLTSPDANLNVNGYTGTGVLRIGGGSTGESNILFADSATGTGQYAGFLQYLHSSDALVFGANAAERMRLDSSGNLGIGTSSPTFKLDVQNSSSRFQVRNGFDTGGTSSGTGLVSVNTANNALTDFNYRAAQHAFVVGASTATAMLLDSSGNLGLGVTPSASTVLALQVSNNTVVGAQGVNLNTTTNAYFDSSFKYHTTGAATWYQQSSGQHAWYTAPSGTAGNTISFTQAMTLDASGNLGVGTTSPQTKLHVAGEVAFWATGNDAFRAVPLATGSGSKFLSTNSANTAYAPAIIDGSIVAFQTSGTERARITSGGSFLVGATSAVASELFLVRTTASAYVGRLANDSATAANCFGQFLWYSSAAPNGTGNQFLRCDDSAATRAEIRSNGGLANYSANDVNLSDRREKTNFAPAKSYLDTICAIPVQTFNYVDQNLDDDPGLTLGVVAQDVQAVAPELVMESNWGTEDNPKMRLSIYQTDLQYALMKALQELKAEFEAYKATHP